MSDAGLVRLADSVLLPGFSGPGAVAVHGGLQRSDRVPASPSTTHRGDGRGHAQAATEAMRGSA